MKVNCPTCGKEIEWSPEEKFRPFCSEKCKLHDLGKWASGENCISTPLTSKDLENEEIAQALEEHYQKELNGENDNK